MPKLTEIDSYDDVMRRFSWDSLWELFDGDRDRMNLAYECIDRHRDKGTAGLCRKCSCVDDVR